MVSTSRSEDRCLLVTDAQVRLDHGGGNDPRLGQVVEQRRVLAQEVPVLRNVGATRPDGLHGRVEVRVPEPGILEDAVAERAEAEPDEGARQVRVAGLPVSFADAGRGQCLVMTVPDEILVIELLDRAKVLPVLEHGEPGYDRVSVQLRRKLLENVRPGTQNLSRRLCTTIRWKEAAKPNNARSPGAKAASCASWSSRPNQTSAMVRARCTAVMYAAIGTESASTPGSSSR